jgi:hypothetical protein
MSTSPPTSFAQTHYPQSRITTYLNNLASAIHNEIYRNKRERGSRFLTFWTHEVPRAMYESRWLLLASLLILVGGRAHRWCCRSMSTRRSAASSWAMAIWT